MSPPIDDELTLVTRRPPRGSRALAFFAGCAFAVGPGAAWFAYDRVHRELEREAVILRFEQGVAHEAREVAKAVEDTRFSTLTARIDQLERENIECRDLVTLSR